MQAKPKVEVTWQVELHKSVILEVSARCLRRLVRLSLSLILVLIPPMLALVL